MTVFRYTPWREVAAYSQILDLQGVVVSVIPTSRTNEWFIWGSTYSSFVEVDPDSFIVVVEPEENDALNTLARIFQLSFME